MTDTTTITGGIDTSKDKLDIAIHGTAIAFTLENTPAGWKILAARLAEAGASRIGIEATGGYERGVTRHLQAAGFTVLVLQPLQTKAFARLHLKRAKNDRIDAALIAACAHLIDAPEISPDKRLDSLADHLTFVEQIEEDIVRFKTRLEHIHDKRLRTAVTHDIARLAARKTSELNRIAASLRGHDDLEKRLDLVLSVPGIGERTAIAIIIRMPELGQISREQAAALAGLAPFDNDSGQHKGERHIAGGRGRLRRSLYAAALAAAFRWNPALKALYTRLTKRGKPHQTALVACARKLLIFANTVVQRGTPWTEKKPELNGCYPRPSTLCRGDASERSVGRRRGQPNARRAGARRAFSRRAIGCHAWNPSYHEIHSVLVQLKPSDGGNLKRLAANQMSH